MSQRIESVDAPKVGDWYSVPCVYGIALETFFGLGYVRWWPVIGSVHSDPEIGTINAAKTHWHFDWRFISERLDDRICLQTFEPSKRIGYSINHDQVQRGPIRRQLRMAREALPFPKCWRAHLPAIAEACNGRRLDLTKMICPHRGICLRGQPIRDGVITCPGHGLKWSATTGELLTECRE